LTVWLTPRVLPWSAWLRQQWLEARASVRNERYTRLLTPAQARVLWNDVVASSAAGAHLLNPASAARLAARSWQRMQEYLIPISQIAAADSAEAAALLAWCKDFVRRCEAMQAIDEARLASWAEEAQLTPAESIALAGFDAVPPSLDRLIQRWRAAGKVVDASGDLHDDPTVAVVGVRDQEAEIDLAARWARAQLESGKASIGIILGDLHTRRAEVKRVFEDVFAPGERGTLGASNALPVVIAAPEPLASYPIVDAAMLILKLAIADASSTHAGRLLRSPFIAGGDSERDRRALADFRLRDDQRDRWDWHELERWAGMTGCEQLQLAARAVGGSIRADSSHAKPSRWAERFHSWLREAGWPGERARSSVEHQTVLKFQAALAEFGTLDAVAPNLSLTAAIARLHELLRDTPFEPETQPTAITIIDPTTVAGMSFDAVWVAGLDAGYLPGPVTPDPLLPLDAQRAAGVPEASAETVIQQARIRLQRWLRSAPEIILSWPEQEGEAALQPSPLLAPWPRKRVDQLPSAAVRPFRRALFEQRPLLTEVRDNFAPPLHASATRGGAMTIELQSRCPFRAQSQLRLRAEALPRVSIGVEPVDRGIVLHRVLAELWGSLRSQEALLALDEQTLLERVHVIVERQALHALRPTVRYRARLATLEIESVVRQVMRLLARDKQRPAFTVRFAETAEPYAIGGLSITLQPDRIDELTDGGHLLIDYKLGDSHQPRQWLDVWPGRPRRPQLPLYGLAHAQTLHALAFVVLAVGAVEYRGWSDGAPIGPGVLPYPAGIRLKPGDPTNWDALMLRWRFTLTQLAEQFVAGVATVDPLPQECTNCHLSTLCRIHEQSRFEAESVSDD
jgi:ATP-dependent helicase/nuclease subunit B